MSTLDEEFNPKPKTTKDWLMKLVDDVEGLKKGQKELSDEVEALKDDLKVRTAIQSVKNKRHNQIVATVGIIFAFLGAIIAAFIEKFYK